MNSIELDLESAMVDLESTQVRIGPGHTRIMPKDILRLSLFLMRNKICWNISFILLFCRWIFHKQWFEQLDILICWNLVRLFEVEIYKNKSYGARSCTDLWSIINKRIFKYFHCLIFVIFQLYLYMLLSNLQSRTTLFVDHDILYALLTLK